MVYILCCSDALVAALALVAKAIAATVLQESVEALELWCTLHSHVVRWNAVEVCFGWIAAYLAILVEHLPTACENCLAFAYLKVFPIVGLQLTFQ